MSSKKPNILFLFTDMQRADTIGALGNPSIRTPGLDRLVREGTAFTQAFSPSPVCVPARCAMQYGLYPMTTGCAENGKMPDANGRSYPALLGAAGYRTHSIGKCHFTPDPLALRGFQTRETQEELIGKSDYTDFLEKNGWHTDNPMGTRGEMYYLPQPSHLPPKVHATQWVGDRAKAFIEGQGGSDKPWCLFASFIHPHPPFTPPMPWHRLYRGPEMPLPVTTQDEGALLTTINRVQNRYKYRDQGRDLNLLRTMKAYYYACISFVDWQVTRLMETLEARGELDNTLILFSSDHGEFLGDFGCFGKRSMHDPSSRIPFLARLPGRFAAGARCPVPVSLVDVLPTFLAVAGVKAPEERLDGEDVSALATGRATRGEVFSQWSNGGSAQYMVVNEQWKYFYSVADRTEFLFHRTTDPLELRNQAGWGPNGAVKKALKQKLLARLKADGVADAWVETPKGLDWKLHPVVEPNQDYDPSRFFTHAGPPADPDSGLLLQDGSMAVFEEEAIKRYMGTTTGA